MKVSQIFHRIIGSNRKNVTVAKVPEEDAGENKEISSFRRYLPQFLACSAKNLLIVEFGFALSFPTILISALSGLNSALNPNETLTISPDETTWIASMTMIFQPLGGLLTGFTEPLGRKRALILVNIPYAIAWLMLYFAQNLIMIYSAFAMLGLGIGLMESPIFTYIGEITQPHIRGLLTVSASIAAAVGSSAVLFIGNQTSWRNSALICAGLPIFSMFVILFVPETPLWLMSKNRDAEAIKSLQWLRGWVDAQTVQNEFSELERYKVSNQICYECEKQQTNCTHPPPTLQQKIRDLFRRRTLRPFILLAFLFFLSSFTGIAPFRPYLVQTLYWFESPVDPNQAVVWIGYVGILANIILVCTIRSIGKRTLFLCTIAAIILISMALGVYGFIYLPLDLTSFDIANSTHVQSVEMSNDPIRYLPLIGFAALIFLGNFGVGAVPNIMLSEVFSFKSKSFATGLVSTSLYFSMFISSKVFYPLEIILTMPGLAIFYGFIGVVGLIAMYLVLPETEGRTLEDIEMYFADRKPGSATVWQRHKRKNNVIDLVDFNQIRSNNATSDWYRNYVLVENEL